MKQALLTLTVLAIAGQALAADADCGTLLLTGTDLTYTTKGAFPAAPETKKFKFLDQDEPVSAQKACGLTFTPDRTVGTLTISAASFKPFSQLFGHLAPSKFPNQLDIQNNLGMEEQHVYFDPIKRSLTFSGKSVSPQQLVAAVKVDGGPIKPLFFDGKAMPIIYPASAKKIDIYMSANKAFVLFWQKASINLKTPSITIFEKAVMPAK